MRRPGAVDSSVWFIRAVQPACSLSFVGRCPGVWFGIAVSGSDPWFCLWLPSPVGGDLGGQFWADVSRCNMAVAGRPPFLRISASRCVGWRRQRWRPSTCCGSPVSGRQTGGELSTTPRNNDHHVPVRLPLGRRTAAEHYGRTGRRQGDGGNRGVHLALRDSPCARCRRPIHPISSAFLIILALPRGLRRGKVVLVESAFIDKTALQLLALGMLVEA